MSTAGGGGFGGWFAILFISLAFALYFLPAAVAIGRNPQPPHVGSVIVINVFAGWTFNGWVVALAMACRSLPRTPQYVVPPGWRPGPGPGAQ